MLLTRGLSGTIIYSTDEETRAKLRELTGLAGPGLRRRLLTSAGLENPADTCAGEVIRDLKP